jgi:hypothetical protein
MKTTTSSEGQRATAREVWENLVTEHAASGQSVEAFCRNRRVSSKAMRYWIAKRKAAPSPLRFVSAVQAGESLGRSVAAKSSGVLVEIAGAAIRVEPGFDRELLLEVVRAIGGSSR